MTGSSQSKEREATGPHARTKVNIIYIMRQVGGKKKGGRETPASAFCPVIKKLGQAGIRKRVLDQPQQNAKGNSRCIRARMAA